MLALGAVFASDADLVIYNYVCRGQAPGIEHATKAGKGVLVMKALGGQWVGWADKARTDWSAVGEEKVVELAPKGEGIRGELPLVYPIVAGPWRELAEPGEVVPRTDRAINWVLATEGVHSALVAFASVEELEEGLGVLEGRITIRITKNRPGHPPRMTRRALQPRQFNPFAERWWYAPCGPRPRSGA